MAVYCFTCRTCGAQWQNSARSLGLHPSNGCEAIDVRRDYQAENVGTALNQLKNERNYGKDGLKRMFLPDNKDFAKAGDPDGTKGMRAWRDTHEPRDSNHRPDWPGSVEKKVF